MGQVAEVVSTGSSAPGVFLPRCSRTFRRVFSEADLVLAKGQGNYESLSDDGGGKTFFLLRAKCGVMARDLDVEIGDFVLTRAAVRRD